MSNQHEASNHQSDNQQFNDELAAFDSSFEEYGVVPTANQHERIDLTDPNNYANSIINRIKAEQAQNKPYSIEDSYNQTLDSVNSVVNENISLDQQYENEMAAFDKILGEYKAQEAEAPRESTAPSPADSKNTTAIPVVEEESVDNDDIEKWKQEVLAMNLDSEQREELLRKGPDNSDLNEKARPARKNNYGLTVKEFEETKKQSLVVDSVEDNHDEKFITSTLEFAGAIKPTKELASDLRGVFEEVKQAKAEANDSPQSNLAEVLRDVANEAMGSGSDTLPIPTNPESENLGFFKRKKAERLEKKNAAKTRKTERKSLKNRLKGTDNGDTVITVPKLKAFSIGSLMRSWGQFKRDKKQRKEYRDMHSFIDEDLLPPKKR